ncbi:MAG TPA: hypothetical protein VH592_21165 [Gemmataceae bacterium]|jgi:hypothetical protein
MAMYCPQCNTTYEQRWQCPLCETRLLFHEVRRLPESLPDRSLRWRQRPLGRILIGLVLSQGLFYGLRHLVTAGLLAGQGREAVEQLGTSAAGILLLQGLRMFALLAGTVFAAAGQHRAAFLGVMIGAWNGVLSVLLLTDAAHSQTLIALLGQPVLQAVMGAIGGWLGTTLWKPVSEASPMETPPPPRPRHFLRRNRHHFTGPVAWVRVSAGVILAVVGTLTATLVFERILDISHGTLATTDELQDRLITLEIKALALLFGGALAGATTRNGLKQGLCVGVASTVILIGIEINYVERWLQMAGYTALAAFSLSLVGGWFGSQLFPPIFRRPRRRGVGAASM